jgi:hypothetical protein
VSAHPKSLSALTRFAAEHGFRSCMVDSSIVDATRLHFVENLLAGLTARNLGLGPVKAFDFINAIGHDDLWREILVTTAYPHQLATSLMNAIIMHSNMDVECIQLPLRILREWVPVESASSLCVSGENLGRVAVYNSNTVARVISEALFGSYWRVASALPHDCEWDELCVDIRTRRPPFLPGILCSLVADAPAALPALEITP